ncbi:hypothetical protein [Demequina subtropica]|uniref:hypothetical protein n=1 Tax=Demequina subtropica TaxID=1638989 RepID=UPI0007819AC9|nr:hypothetical protein [Demequina subtropica]
MTEHEPLTYDQQGLAHAIRALGADPDHKPTRRRMHEAARRLTSYEVLQVFDTLPDAVVDRADVGRWTRPEGEG